MPISSVFCHLSCHLVSCHILFLQVSTSHLWSASISLSIYIRAYCVLPFLPICNIVTISSLVCLDFSFHLYIGPTFICNIVYSHHHPRPSFTHVHTGSISSLGVILPSDARTTISRCLHFSHDPVLSFVLPTVTCAFQVWAISSPHSS